jgi:diamine N-acetyltransferase
MPNLVDYTKFAEENNFRVRSADITDISLISTLGITTCYEAYFELDVSKDLAAYSLEAFSLEQLTREFEDMNSTFIIAELDSKAIGFAKLREGKRIECLKDKHAIEVQRIYILEKVKGKKFGSYLLEKCFQIGKEKGYETLWLGVWDQNLAAQKFYEKLKFENIGVTEFAYGDETTTSLVMVKKIEK